MIFIKLFRVELSNRDANDSKTSPVERTHLILNKFRRKLSLVIHEVMLNEIQ